MSDVAIVAKNAILCEWRSGLIFSSIIHFFSNLVISEMIHRRWASPGNRRHIVSFLIKQRCTCNVMPYFMPHTGLHWILCIMYPFTFCEYSPSGADILPSLLLCRHAASQHETITCIMEGYSCSGDRNSTSHVIWTGNCCALFNCGYRIRYKIVHVICLLFVGWDISIGITTLFISHPTRQDEIISGKFTPWN